MCLIVHGRRIIKIMSIVSTINRIHNESRTFLYVRDVSLLHHHNCELDDVDRIVHIYAEIYPDCLDRGSDITEHTARCVSDEGALGDTPFQLFSKRLGGSEHHFDFFSIDMTTWKENETKVYEHVKEGGDRYALMAYSFEYDNQNEHQICRPIKIYYYVALFDLGDPVGEEVEGMIYNQVM
ncbi:hypothetical protein M3Y98_01150500 [Aphelenchoides besseyi]|nr:hypothetical protein M3Y98_01150500 [Aphelenchoides besseyi]